MRSWGCRDPVGLFADPAPRPHPDPVRVTSVAAFPGGGGPAYNRVHRTGMPAPAAAPAEGRGFLHVTPRHPAEIAATAETCHPWPTIWAEIANRSTPRNASAVTVGFPQAWTGSRAHGTGAGATSAGYEPTSFPTFCRTSGDAMPAAEPAPTGDDVSGPPGAGDARIIHLAPHRTSGRNGAAAAHRHRGGPADMTQPAPTPSEGDDAILRPHVEFLQLCYMDRGMTLTDPATLEAFLAAMDAAAVVNSGAVAQGILSEKQRDDLNGMLDGMKRAARMAGE